MMEIAAIGTSEFLLGFELAGVDRTYLASARTVLERLRECADAGIVVVDETITDGLTGTQRERLETSVAPVIILLARDGTRQLDRLRKELQNTLGVDLLK